MHYAFTPPIFCQNVSVKSIVPLDYDITAHHSNVTDNNGQKAALIRVVTTERGFNFDFGQLGLVRMEPQTRGGEHDAEIWLWVPAGVRRMTVQHPTLGMLRDYDLVGALGKALEPGRTYELVLESGQVNVTQVSDWSRLQTLNITVTPPDADVFINGVPQALQDGKASQRLPLGDVKVRVSKPLYETYEATVKLTEHLPEDLDVRLVENAGWLMFAETPEYDGAQVLIDGKVIGLLPLREVKVDAGPHELLVTKPLYSPYRETINVVRNTPRRVEPRMAANFANITVEAPKGCEILIDGNPRGVGMWSGRLDPGTYIAEASRPNHTPSRLEFTVATGSTKTITLPEPTPITGALEVMTVPGGGDVYLDGKMIGHTGQTFDDVLIGDHTLRIVNDGYKPHQSGITVEEGRVTRLSYILDGSCDITVNSRPEGAEVTLDGQPAGVTPFPLHTDAGDYTLRFTRQKYYPRTVKCNLNGSSEDLTVTLKRKYFNEITLSVGYDPIGPNGLTVGLGTYIDDFSIFLWGSPVMTKTPAVYWNSTTPTTPPAQATYKPMAFGGKVGYGFRFLGDRLRLTPQVGAAFTRLSEQDLGPVPGFSSETALTPVANGSNVVSVTAGLRLRYKVWKFIGVSVSPEYRIAVKESAGFKHLRTNVPDDFKKYAEGFGLTISADFFLP